MDWILFWQIAGPIIGVLGISVAVWLFLLSHREKVAIEFPNMLAQLKTNEANGIQFEYSFSLIYVRGTRDRYVSEICVEFDKSSWKKLNPHFKLPLRITRGFGHDELSKLEVGKPKQFGYDDFFPARKVISEEECEELDNLVQELWHRYKIGWKDTYRKTHWEMINQLRIRQKEEVM
jgi:hypothetical protein